MKKFQLGEVLMLELDLIGQRIALLRKEKGYTQEELGEKIHVTPQAVSKWEKGQALPEITLLPVLSDIFGISIDKLLTGGNRAGKGPYDEEYKKGAFYWGLKASFLAEQVVSLMRDRLDRHENLRVLDIGSGEGRDAVYFARNGFHVDALELSAPGVEKIRQYSQSMSCVVNVIHADMTGYELGCDYDVVFSMGSLQFLPVEQRRRHFELWKSHTRPYGLNAYSVFVKKPFLVTAPDWQENEYFYISGDLASHYHDWEIFLSAERTFDCRSSGVPHRHVLDSLIGRKIPMQKTVGRP